MADFVQSLDPSKLVLVETILSFITSPFVAPTYNLPIFLFGMYAQESSEATQSLKAFTFLLGGSAVFDIIFMARHSQAGLIRLFTILILVVKFPTALAFAAALRLRGAQFSGLGGGAGAGQTVWAMPGGFTSFGGGNREGYETVEEPNVGDHQHQSKPAAAQPPAAHNNPTAPGGYQAV